MFAKNICVNIATVLNLFQSARYAIKKKKCRMSDKESNAYGLHTFNPSTKKLVYVNKQHN